MAFRQRSLRSPQLRYQPVLIALPLQPALLLPRRAGQAAQIYDDLQNFEADVHRTIWHH